MPNKNKFNWGPATVPVFKKSQCATCEFNGPEISDCGKFEQKPDKFWDNKATCPERKEKVKNIKK